MKELYIFCTESYKIKFRSVKKQLISLCMQSYYQYFIARLVSARSVIVFRRSELGQFLSDFDKLGIKIYVEGLSNK